MIKISYELFKTRRNFNPITLFLKKSDLSYDEFCNYFNKINVVAPDFEYFQKVKNFFISLSNSKESFEEKIIENDQQISNEISENNSDQLTEIITEDVHIQDISTKKQTKKQRNVKKNDN
jgi:hypothetical protein